MQYTAVYLLHFSNNLTKQMQGGHGLSGPPEKGKRALTRSEKGKAKKIPYKRDF